MKSLNILFLTAHLPVLGVHGGGQRMYYNVKTLSERYRVTVLSFIESERERDWLSQLENLGVTVETVLRRPAGDRHLLVPTPKEHQEYHSEAMTELFCRTWEKQPFDVVQAEYLQMGQHIPLGLPAWKILTEHEVQFSNAYADFQGARSLFGKLRRFYEWMVQFNYEVRMCRRFDRVVCMTDEDKAQFQGFLPSRKLETIPIGIDCEYFRRESLAYCPGSAAGRFLFVGNYRHPPNQEVVYHFAEQILPRILSDFPSAEFDVVGANLHLLDHERLKKHGHVNLIGYVDDVRPYYQRADVFVAPILSGNGMRVKMLEACAMGMAIVASPLAVQGFKGNPDEEFCVAAGPEDFAVQVVRLLREPFRGKHLGAQARKLVEKLYDWKVIGRQLLDLVESRDA